MQYDTTTMSLKVKPGLSPTTIALIEAGDYPVKIKLTNSLGIALDFTVNFTVKIAKAPVKEEIKPATTPTPPAEEIPEEIPAVVEKPLVP